MLLQHSNGEISIVPVSGLDLTYRQRRWAFTAARRREIDEHFAALRRKTPTLWNGQVLMLGDFAIADKVFRGTYFSADYASFLAWRDWGYPDPRVRDCFATGVIRACDGGLLLGVMASSTANAGLIYFPCGTPDHADLVAGKVNLEGSVRREISEETGVDIAEFAAEPGWLTVLAGPRIAHMKLLRARAPAASLRARILAHLARQSEPELADIRIVCGPADLDPMMPPYVVAFLQHIWRHDDIGAHQVRLRSN